MTARGAPPPARVYPVTRPGWLMAQATLPGLPGMLRPVFAPPVTVVPTRLTPRCESAPARMSPACRDVPRGVPSPERTLVPGTSRAAKWFNLIAAASKGTLRRRVLPTPRPLPRRYRRDKARRGPGTAAQTTCQRRDNRRLLRGRARGRNGSIALISSRQLKAGKNTALAIPRRQADRWPQPHREANDVTGVPPLFSRRYGAARSGIRG